MVLIDLIFPFPPPHQGNKKNINNNNYNTDMVLIDLIFPKSIMQKTWQPVRVLILYLRDFRIFKW